MLQDNKYIKLGLSSKDPSARFILHLNDLEYILEAYHKSFRNDTSENFAERRNLDKVIFITNDYVKDKNTFIELMKIGNNKYKIGSIIHSHGDHGWATIHDNNELKYDDYNDAKDNLALFELEDENKE